MDHRYPGHKDVIRVCHPWLPDSGTNLSGTDFARSQAPAWECGFGSSSFPKHGKLELAAPGSQPGGWEPALEIDRLVSTVNQNQGGKVIFPCFLTVR